MSEAGVVAPIRFGLLGSPNSGKTTLFNALTGLHARVGNYPGVTVERREGRAEIDGRQVVMIDLPGTYSLAAISPDEAIVSRVAALLAAPWRGGSISPFTWSCRRTGCPPPGSSSPRSGAPPAPS